MREPLKFEELKTLQTAEAVADAVWRQVMTWEPFAREAVGGQLARAVDSIGANIAESYGRFHYKALMAFESVTEWSNDTQAPLFAEDELAWLQTIPNPQSLIPNPQSPLERNTP